MDEGSCSTLDILFRSARTAARESGIDYQEYTHSSRWRELRKAALERDGFRCRGCDGADLLEVHHRRYPAHPGEETVDDLTTLCGGPRGCHRAVHKAINRRRRALAARSAAEGPVGSGDPVVPLPSP